MEYTMSPNIWQHAVGRNSACAHEPVLSSMYPAAVTPSTPGSAPAVLLRPEGRRGVARGGWGEGWAGR